MIRLQIYSEDGSLEQLRALNEDGNVLWTSPKASHGAWQSLVCPEADYMDDWGIVPTNPPVYNAIIAWLEAGLDWADLNKALMARLYDMDWISLSET